MRDRSAVAAAHGGGGNAGPLRRRERDAEVREEDSRAKRRKWV